MDDHQAKALDGLAVKRNYGRGKPHAYQVKKMALQIYEGLTETGMLARSNRTQQFIEISSLLHDIGLPIDPHNEAGFDVALNFLKGLPGSLPADEASAILYCILWHRGDVFVERGGVGIADRKDVEKIASIIRIADALDRTLQQVVDSVSLELSGLKAVFTVRSKGNADTELRRAKVKSDLMKAAYGFIDVSFKPGIPSKKKILLVCGGNTCRSPMAKVILERKLHAAGLSDRFEVDSAAYDGPTSQGASTNARKAIEKQFGQDLLASHVAKKLTSALLEPATVILVMGKRMKVGLPAEKTWTLMEYSGSSGDIADPYHGTLDTYLKCAKQISDAMDGVSAKLLVENGEQSNSPRNTTSACFNSKILMKGIQPIINEITQKVHYTEPWALHSGKADGPYRKLLDLRGDKGVERLKGIQPGEIIAVVGLDRMHVKYLYDKTGKLKPAGMICYRVDWCKLLAASPGFNIPMVKCPVDEELESTMSLVPDGTHIMLDVLTTNEGPLKDYGERADIYECGPAPAGGGFKYPASVQANVDAGMIKDTPELRKIFGG